MNESAGRDDYADIRESVRALCARFPGEYWRGLDRERAYPTAFVAALTEAGYLAALIPEEYGGSGLTVGAAAAIMEEVHAAGCNGAGIVKGTVLGKRLAEHIAGHDEQSDVRATYGSASWVAPEPFRWIGFNVVSAIERRKAGLET